uniref:Uncharacterized protein n=1 Tax=Knipowitschia caucasica TaxID=637954 RepID=A0AAV2J049_KNICA
MKATQGKVCAEGRVKGLERGPGGMRRGGREHSAARLNRVNCSGVDNRGWQRVARVRGPGQGKEREAGHRQWMSVALTMAYRPQTPLQPPYCPPLLPRDLNSVTGQ